MYFFDSGAKCEKSHVSDVSRFAFCAAGAGGSGEKGAFISILNLKCFIQAAKFR